jgi:hypothetical protein
MSNPVVGAALLGLEVVAGIIAFATALFLSTELLERRLDAPHARDKDVKDTRKLSGAPRRRRPSPRARATGS